MFRYTQMITVSICWAPTVCQPQHPVLARTSGARTSHPIELKKELMFRGVKGSLKVKPKDKLEPEYKLTTNHFLNHCTAEAGVVDSAQHPKKWSSGNGRESLPHNGSRVAELGLNRDLFIVHLLKPFAKVVIYLEFVWFSLVGLP